MFTVKQRVALGFCVLISSASAIGLEGGTVRHLNETIPRAVAFGAGLFALWLGIWLLMFRAIARTRRAKAIADPVVRSWRELTGALKIAALVVCAMALFILFPWAQGFPMPYCSLLALKLSLAYCIYSLVIVIPWGVITWAKAVRAQKRARLAARDDASDVTGAPRRTASGVGEPAGPQAGMI